MKLKMLAPFFVLWAFLGLSCVRTGVDLTSGGYHHLAESVVMIKITGMNLCTGFFIADEEILTAAHCLDSRPLQVYEVIGYRQYLADDDLTTATLFRLVQADPLRDVALLEALVEGTVHYRHHPVELYNGREPQVGSPTFSIAHPTGQYFNLTTGIVSRVSNLDPQTMVMYLFSSTPVYFGSSGGPLFDGRGRVIGLTNSIRDRQAFLGRYVSYGELRDFMEEIRE